MRIVPTYFTRVCKNKLHCIHCNHIFGMCQEDIVVANFARIEGLGNTVVLTLWHEMALNFNVQEYEAMEKPVVITVSSCWVRRFNRIQLSGTSATHCYLNPNIPETYHIKQQYLKVADTIPILNIDHQRYQDLELEKNRNRFPLAVLFEIDPQNYQANSLTRDCNELLAKLSDKDPYHLPYTLKDLEDTTVPSQQELDLLFGPLYYEFFNDGTSRVNKSSSPTDNSVPQDTHPSTNIQPTSEPSTPTNAHVEENNVDQAEFTNPFC
ncbi:DNA helicase [Tanacetum coccineum]